MGTTIQQTLLLQYIRVPTIACKLRRLMMATIWLQNTHTHPLLLLLLLHQHLLLLQANDGVIVTTSAVYQLCVCSVCKPIHVPSSPLPLPLPLSVKYHHYGTKHKAPPTPPPPRTACTNTNTTTTIKNKHRHRHKHNNTATTNTTDTAAITGTTTTTACRNAYCHAWCNHATPRYNAQLYAKGIFIKKISTISR